MAIAEVDREAAARAALAAVFASERTFDAWYERVLPQVFGYVYARCGRDRDLAEDLTQQAFVEAIRSRDRFDGEADPATWVCGIARHKLADHFRRLDADERRRLRLVERLEPRASETCDGDVAEREAISTALATLPALQRAVLLFAALDGLTSREIGRLVGRSEGAVESLLYRARGSFRRAYGVGEGRSDA